MRIASLIFFLILLTAPVCFASFSIPQNLSAADRKQAMDVLGLGTASKFLSTAYPLGGYSGLEVSASGESFDVDSVNRLGNGSGGADSLFFPQITVGKGLYNHSDIFISFVPFKESSKLSRFGLQYRASLYQADFFPINISMLLHGNSANINNQLTTRTIGGDLIIGTMINDFSFNITGGYVDSSGDFIGGVNGVTDTGETERSSTSSLHLGMSAVYRWDMVIFGLSIDRYRDAAFKFKIGLFL